MRATDGRPYELQSVPTKTVAVRSTDNGAKIYIVGASIARPFLTVSSAVSGLADAKDVSALSFMRLC